MGRDDSTDLNNSIYSSQENQRAGLKKPLNIPIKFYDRSQSLSIRVT